MEVLRNLFGNLSSGIIRLGVTVGILAAVYFFIVRPALDTTKQISKEANESVSKGFKSFDGNTGAPVDVEKTIREVNAKVQREIKRSFHVAHIDGGPASPKRLVKCIRRADGNVHKIQHCTVKF